MFLPHPPEPGRFCWLDLAARDAARAKQFYAQAFGWTFRDQAANGGHFTRLRCGEHDTGTLYQLGRAQIERGVPSHWTPYVAVADLDDAVRGVTAHGGTVIVPPVVVEGAARIALIEDAVGALVGLWQIGATAT
jgi:predicted enzyme related to lactoylglutathione lyase